MEMRMAKFWQVIIESCVLNEEFPRWRLSKMLVTDEFLWEGHKFFAIDLSYVVNVKSKVDISQNFVAFSEYMNFT